MQPLPSRNKFLFLGGYAHGKFYHVEPYLASMKIPRPTEVRWRFHSEIEFPDASPASYETYYREKLYDHKTGAVKELFIISGLKTEDKDHLLYTYLLERFINGG